MAAAGHILKRILLVLAGYLLGLLAGLFAIVALYSALSSLPGAPAYFGAMSMTPVAVLLVPPVGVFIYVLAIFMTAAQSLALALIAESFALRQFWLHMLFGAVAAASGYALVAPISENAGWTLNNADMGIVAASGLAGGFVYWLIAGRDAGFRRPRIGVTAG
jgi:hypothetical protein